MDPSVRRRPVSHGPATPGSPARGFDSPPSPGPSRTATYTLSACLVLAGIWLVIAPFGLKYGDTGGGFDARWNDIVVGAAIIVFALARAFAPAGAAALSIVNALLGIWLVIAPFALNYGAGTDAEPAIWNDIIIGVIVVLLAAVNWFAAQATKERR